MKTPAAPALRALFVGVAWTCVSACYSWQVGAVPTDSGRDADDGRDAEVHLEGAPSTDVVQPREGSPATDGSHEAVDATAACASLLAAANAARTQAKACTQTTPPECATFVTDSCGCRVFVAQPTSSATDRYTTAIEALKSSRCEVDCASPPCATTETTFALCLLAIDGGTSCSP